MSHVNVGLFLNLDKRVILTLTLEENLADYNAWSIACVARVIRKGDGEEKKNHPAFSHSFSITVLHLIPDCIQLAIEPAVMQIFGNKRKS